MEQLSAVQVDRAVVDLQADLEQRIKVTEELLVHKAVVAEQELHLRAVWAEMV
jgi:hypothetical protein